MDSTATYTPAPFQVSERTHLEAFIKQVGFGVLLSNGTDGAIRHSWLPLTLSSDRNSLEGHLARANPHWQQWEHESRVSVLFLGPHTYVSPKAYSDVNSVPTWNYASSRIDGRVRVVSEDSERWQIVARLVAQHEGTGETAWKLRSDSEFVQGLLRGIVCFRIEIESFAGKFKMSQNKPADERQRVIQYLRNSPGAADATCAAFMEELYGSAHSDD